MDFAYKYSEDQEEFRKEVRSWLEENIPDDMRAPVDRNELSDEQYSYWRDMHMVLADKGWLYPTYPKEYGGGGLSGEHETIIQEEFRRARVVPGFTNGLVFPTLLVWADEPQKKSSSSRCSARRRSRSRTSQSRTPVPTSPRYRAGRSATVTTSSSTVRRYGSAA